MATLFAELPVGDRWELSATDIATVADNYALGKYRIGTQPLGGAVNGIARIACDQGEWIVRVHRPWTLSARLGGIHAVQDALRTDGHPIPRVLRDTTGATFTRLADRLVEVIEYVPSEGVADDWRRSALAFETLGTLQASLARIAPELLPPPAYSSYTTPETALAMLAETDAIFQELSSAADDRAATRTREQARAALEILAVERRRYKSSLSWGYVHGDYGGDNLLLAGGRVVAILDFDFMAYRERIFDVAYGCYWALDRFRDGRDGEVISTAHLSRLGAMVSSYQRNAATPLNQAEISALPLEMARVPLYWLAEAGYLGDSRADTRPIEQTLRFARHIPIARHLIDNAGRIGRHFSQTLG